MKLPPLTGGRILRRYKRFLADVELSDGTTITAHCANTGSMQSCWAPGVAVELSYSDNPKRKLPWTLERIDMGGGWIGINTSRVNAIILEGIRNHCIEVLDGYGEIRREPVFNVDGFPKSRFDLYLADSEHERADAYVEIKNATLLRDGKIQFPDAVTERGRKHLDLLEVAVQQGFEAFLVFAINRPETTCFQVAADIDPAYANRLASVVGRGVKVILARLVHSTDGIEVGSSVLWSPTVS